MYKLQNQVNQPRKQREGRVSRRKFLGAVGAAVTRFTFAPLLLLGLLVSTAAASGADRPNVLFIAVDDLRPELATYGAKIQTPNFDRLAASGMRFERAYCVQAVCGASRL